MKAFKPYRQRIIYCENKFAGFWHSFKYRLAYAVNQEFVLRYANESVTQIATRAKPDANAVLPHGDKECMIARQSL